MNFTANTFLKRLKPVSTSKLLIEFERDGTSFLRAFWSVETDKRYFSHRFSRAVSLNRPHKKNLDKCLLQIDCKRINVEDFRQSVGI